MSHHDNRDGSCDDCIIARIFFVILLYTNMEIKISS